MGDGESHRRPRQPGKLACPLVCTIACLLLMFSALYHPVSAGSAAAPANSGPQPGKQLSRLFVPIVVQDAESGGGEVTPGQRTYYVAPNGNDGWPGSISAPWRTISKAARSLAAGNTVYIRAGTYKEQVKPRYSGNTRQGYITYAAYPGEKVTLDGNGLVLGSADGLFWINGRSYIQVSGLSVINARGGAHTAGIRMDNSHDILISGNHTTYTASSGIGVWGSYDVTVDGNEIESANQGGADENLTVSGSHDVQITDNHVHDGMNSTTGGEGIVVKNGSHDVQVHGNRVHDQPKLAFGVDGASKGAYDIELEGNTAYNAAAGFVILPGQGGTVHDVKLDNNVAYANAGPGFDIPGADQADQSLKQSITIVNNTSHDNATGVAIRATGVKDIVVRNNILSRNGTQTEVVEGAAADTTVDHNLFDGGGAAGEGAIQGDAAFVNPDAGDFHIGKDSAAVDDGSASNAPNRDKDGNARPQGAGYDIGAYEATGQDPTPTATPTATPTDAPTEMSTPTPAPTDTPLPAPLPTATSSSTPMPTDAPTATNTPIPPSATPTPTATATAGPPTYYVDSALGSDANSCTAARNPATPKKTVYSVMTCNPGAGETVRFRGEFRETIKPTHSGAVLYDVQDIAQVSGSTVTFNQAITNLNPATDYVTIYGSRLGNSGAFAVVAVSGQSVTVDTSSLPGGQFSTETAGDPGDLKAAILRPVVFTAWDRANPPVFSGPYHAFTSFNARSILVSYLKSTAGVAVNPGTPVWATFKIDGGNGGNSDFTIFDHLEVVNAECAIAIESHEFRSNYDIIQYNYLHDIGSLGTGSDEIIYFGYAFRPDLHHDFVQIMYNRVGPHTSTADLGDGIEIKPSAHHATVFGNDITGINAQGCDDAPIRVDGIQAFVANNYLHDISPKNYAGCGISIIDGAPSDTNSGADGAIVANNIVANVKGIGVRVIDASGVQLLNNTVYNIAPEPNCDATCLETNMGIGVWNYQGATQNLVIKNNIVQGVHIGIGRYIWSKDYPVSIANDYNLVSGTDLPFRGTITQGAHDKVVDPGLQNAGGRNFTLAAGSPARDAGENLSGVFRGDNHDADDPSLPAVTAPVARSGAWDIGAFEAQ